MIYRGIHIPMLFIRGELKIPEMVLRSSHISPILPRKNSLSVRRPLKGVDMQLNRKGQSLVEFSLVCPLLILLFFGGIVDLGSSFNNWITLQQIANEASQWASETNGTIGRSQAEVANHIASRKPAWWGTSLRIELMERVALTSGGTAIRVVLAYDSPIYSPVNAAAVSGVSGGPVIPLRATALYQIPVKLVSKQ